jgi:hypothetical protein
MKKVENFISTEEAKEILDFSLVNRAVQVENEHIKNINDAIAGWSITCDLTETDISKAISVFQGDRTLVKSVPSIFYDLSHRIADRLTISRSNIFFQYIVVGSGGVIRKHYDAGIPGYVTYKCNICVSGPSQDSIHIDNTIMELTNRDLYAFEANLYKHWMDVSDTRRVQLSYGFILPCGDLGWEQDNPRVRLSNKLYERYMKKYMS